MGRKERGTVCRVPLCLSGPPNLGSVLCSPHFWLDSASRQVDCLNSTFRQKAGSLESLDNTLLFSVFRDVRDAGCIRARATSSSTATPNCFIANAIGLRRRRGWAGGNRHAKCKAEKNHGLHIVAGTLPKGQNARTNSVFISAVFVFLWRVRFVVHPRAKSFGKVSRLGRIDEPQTIHPGGNLRSASDCDHCAASTAARPLQ